MSSQLITSVGTAYLTHAGCANSFFNGNLPHASTINKSNHPSYALIGRVYDYRKDLTLSDKTGIKLYEGGKAGFPGLRPIL